MVRKKGGRSEGWWRKEKRGVGRGGGKRGVKEKT